MSRVRILFLMLFCAAFLVPTSPAAAGSSLLCTGYSSCSDKGYPHYGYAQNKSTSYWRMYTGTNCTNYVAYRLVTTNGMPNVRPKSSVGNAKDWGYAMASITDSTPAVGSVAWWGKTGHHVAYVEKVVSSSEIWVSESNWSGAFDWRKITKSGSGWPDGFIHFKDLKIVNTVKPSISGTVKVGNALTALVGAWTPTGNTHAYQWRADGQNISGAVSKTFTPTSAQVGKLLSVSVTASRTSYPSTRATSTSTKVAPGALRATTAPKISGTARVDSTLTATTGTWSPTGATYAHQWMRDGTAVPGATGTTFTPGPAEVGRRITVRVTASKAGYADVAATTAPTDEVAPGLLSATTKPAISGTPKVGSPLTAHPGTWSKPGLTYAYQWYVNGAAARGASARTFVPRAEDVDLPVRVEVTASKDGYAPTTAVSPQTAHVVRGTFASTSRPTITGSHTRVGSRLTATPGTWSPTGTYSYQWYADGVAIAGATARTFTPTKSERGDKVRVRVTASNDGFVPKSAQSDSTQEIGYGRIHIQTPPKVTGAVRLGQIVSVAPGEHTPAGASMRLQWLRDDKVITGATKRSRRVTTSDLGRRLSVRVKLSSGGYTTRTITTQPTARAKTTSTVRASARPGTRKVAFTIRVAASGVAAPDGKVRVSFGRDQYRIVKIVDGRASLSLTGQASGARKYVFRFLGTSKVAPSSYSKTVTIG